MGADNPVARSDNGKLDFESSAPKLGLDDQKVAGGNKSLHLDDPLDPNYVPDTSGNPIWRIVKAFCTEGHTAIDAFLSSSNAMVGQVILTYPYNLALMGIASGIPVALFTQAVSLYTLWLLIILFLDRKQERIANNKWFNSTDANGFQVRKQVTQYHDLIGHGLGKWGQHFAQLITAVSLFGLGIAQIVASSSSQYSIYPKFDKLEWGLILGFFVIAPSLLPTCRDVRIINIIALVGTNYSCLYFFIYGASQGIKPGFASRPPASLKAFFLGKAVVASGGHTFQIEMMDAMRQPRKFDLSSTFSLLWNLTLLIPHSTALVLGLPKASTQANVYAILPNSGWKVASVWLMLIHNIGAFTLHLNPLCFMWERWIGTHTLSNWIRVPSRLPMLLAIWVVSLAIPFYGTVNSLFSSLCSGFSGFILPCLAFNVYYRTQARRDNCPYRISKFAAVWNWKLLFWFNWFVIVLFAVTSVGFGIWASTTTLVSNIKTFSWFARCYQCPKPVVKAVAKLAPKLAPAIANITRALSPASG